MSWTSGRKPSPLAHCLSMRPVAQDRDPERQRGGLPLLPEDGLHPGCYRPVRLSRPASRGAAVVVEGAGIAWREIGLTRFRCLTSSCCERFPEGQQISVFPHPDHVIPHGDGVRVVVDLAIETEDGSSRLGREADGRCLPAAVGSRARGVGSLDVRDGHLQAPRPSAGT